MKRFFSFIIVLIPFVLSAQNINFSDYFDNKTVNLESYHSGRFALEYYTIDNSYISGDWAGTRTKLIDNNDFGQHKVEILDAKTKKLLYSRTYSSLFEEWSTTSEGKTSCGNFEEVIRIPLPKSKVIIGFNSRDSLGAWKKIADIEWDRSMIIDDNSTQTRKHYALHENGNIKNRLDILIIPAGYSTEDSIKMRKDLKMFSEFIFSKPPFSKAKDKINVWGIEYFSEESGIPGLKDSKINPNTELGVSYNTLGSPRYLMTRNLMNLHRIIKDIPYEQIIIMCNSEVYGGGGIYNFYATSYVNPKNSFVVVHEFGHSFAALGDEYAQNDSDVQGATENVEPWQLNVTALKDFSKKWGNMMDKTTPIPTPVTEEYKEKIGVFEGAAYKAKGLYRPYQDCLMRSDKPFCPVCTKAINDMINFYTE